MQKQRIGWRGRALALGAVIGLGVTLLPASPAAADSVTTYKSEGQVFLGGPCPKQAPYLHSDGHIVVRDKNNLGTFYQTEVNLESETYYHADIAQAALAWPTHKTGAPKCADLKRYNNWAPEKTLREIACAPGARNRPVRWCGLTAAEQAAIDAPAFLNTYNGGCSGKPGWKREYFELKIDLHTDGLFGHIATWFDEDHHQEDRLGNVFVDDVKIRVGLDGANFPIHSKPAGWKLYNHKVMERWIESLDFLAAGGSRVDAWNRFKNNSAVMNILMNSLCPLAPWAGAVDGYGALSIRGIDESLRMAIDYSRRRYAGERRKVAAFDYLCEFNGSLCAPGHNLGIGFFRLTDVPFPQKPTPADYTKLRNFFGAGIPL